MKRITQKELWDAAEIQGVQIYARPQPGRARHYTLRTPDGVTIADANGTRAAAEALRAYLCGLTIARREIAEKESNP